jgi:putative transcriptional regulator
VAGLVVRIAAIGTIAALGTIGVISLIPIGGDFCRLEQKNLTSNPSIPASPLLVQSREDPAKGMFLIADQKLQDPNFSQTVVLLLDYGDHGAMGLVVNRPTDVALFRVFPDMEGLRGRAETLFFGGPVDLDKVFILIRSDSQPSSDIPVIKNLYLSGNTDALEQIFNDTQREARVYAGYAGWAPQQLDAEIARGDWTVVPADAQTVFDAVPAEIWQKLMNRGKIRSVEVQPRSWSNRHLIPACGFKPG